MSTDLRTQTRDLFSEVDGLQESIDVAEILRRAESVRSAGQSVAAAADRDERFLTTGLKRRRALLAAAAAILTLVLIGGAAWLSRPQPRIEPADQSTITTLPPQEPAPDAPTLDPHVTDVIASGTPQCCLSAFFGNFLATEDGLWLATDEDEVVRVDPATRVATSRVPIDGNVQQLVASPDAVWAIVTGPTREGPFSAVRIDAKTRQITDTVTLAEEPSRAIVAVSYAVVADGGLWVRAPGEGLVRIDLETRTIIDTIRPFPSATWAAQIADAVWWYGDADQNDCGPRGCPMLTRLDLDTLEVTEYALCNCDWDVKPILSNDAIWLLGGPPGGGRLFRFDLETHEVTVVPVGGSLIGGTSVEGAVWVIDEDGSTINRVDIATGEVTDVIELTARPGPAWLAATEEALWISVPNGVLARIDHDSRRVTHRLTVGPAPGQLLVVGDAIWVTDFDDGTLTRIEMR